MAQFVRYCGPFWGWSTFDFEDANGFFKQITYGSNAIYVKVLNAIKIINDSYVLKYKLNIKSEH